MPKILLSLLILATTTGCQDAQRAKHSLNGRGYSQVQLTGYEPSTCGLGIGFLATGPDGMLVKGVICSKWELKTTAVNLL